MSAMGLLGGLEADWCTLLGVSLIPMKSNAWSRGVTRGATQGFRFPLFGGTYSWLSPGASNVRDLWLCPEACYPFNLLSTDWTWKPRAPARLSSPGVHFLTQERAHQLRWLCLKAGLCCVQGHFIFPLHAFQSIWPHLASTAAYGPADQMIWSCGQAARGAGGEAEAWNLGSWEGSQAECEMDKPGSRVPGKERGTSDDISLLK